MENIKIQVESGHYDFLKYVGWERWCSYYHQVSETVRLKPKTALIVGIGDNIVGEILRTQGIEVFTYDFDETLKPDFVGNVTDIDVVLQGKSFDVVLVCQILEHIPYTQFEDVLRKIRMVSAHVILSLPHLARNLTLGIKLHNYKTRHFHFALHQWWREIRCKNEPENRKSWWKIIQLHPEHYWEIGKGKYTKRRVRKSIQKHFSIKKTFLAKGNHNILFYVLN